MAHSFKSVSIRQIYLDNKNPRHDPIESEPEIIAVLLASENVKQLAKDIAAAGVSPLDRLGVIQHPTAADSYVAVEGNRRICALKLLADPEKAPKEPVRRFFRDLKASMISPISKVEVAVFDSRSSSSHWRRIRHEGELGGAGTKRWKSGQITRFNAEEGKRDNPNLLANELLNYAEHRGLITKQDRQSISQTTLTRYLSNPVFRSAIGITSTKELRTNALQEQFDRAAAKFLVDAKVGTNVHSRSDAKARKAYAESLMAQGYSPTTRAESDSRLHPDTGVMDPLPGSKKRQERDNRSPDKRRHIIPSEFQCRINSPVQKRIYDELKRIETEDFTFSAAYLLRAFVEMTTRGYLRKHRLLPTGRQELHELIGKAADHLQQHYRVPAAELKALRTMADKSQRDVGYSPETLGAAVHGSIVPTRPQLNRHWDSMQDGLRHLVDRS